MGTGAESPGLSCPLDVDLFPAYSDDSPLCDCSFGIPMEFGESFYLFSDFFLFPPYARSLGLHLSRVFLLSFSQESRIAWAFLCSCCERIFGVFSMLFVSYSFAAHLLLVLIVRRDQVLTGIDFPWAISRTCRCRCLCMESTWISLRLFLLVFLGAHLHDRCACSATVCLGWTLSCLYSVLIRWHSRFAHAPLAVAFALYATALLYSIPF